MARIGAATKASAATIPTATARLASSGSRSTALAPTSSAASSSRQAGTTAMMRAQRGRLSAGPGLAWRRQSAGPAAGAASARVQPRAPADVPPAGSRGALGGIPGPDARRSSAS